MTPPLRTLLRAVFRKRLILLVRYPVNTASRVVTLYVFFVLLFFGGRAVAGPALGGSLPGLIVGFFLFTMAVSAYAGLASTVTREAQWGTLEQLFTSPYGIGRVMGATLLADLLVSFLYGGVVLLLMLLTTGRTLAVDLLAVAPLVALTLAPAAGVGFAVGGLALLYKRVENAFQLVQFAFVGLIAAPVDRVPALAALPLAQGSHMLRAAMTEGRGLAAFPPADLAVLVLTAAGYLLAGYAAFRRAVWIARRRGVLGEY